MNKTNGTHWTKIWAACLVLSAASGQVAAASEYEAGWGPELGSPAPEISAQDQSGAARDLSSLAGEHGLLLFMNRSADW